MTEHHERDEHDPGLPGLARVAAYAALHTTEWGVRTSAQAWKRVGRAVADPDEAAALVHDAGRAIDLVGEVARSVTTGTPVAQALIAAAEQVNGSLNGSTNGSTNGRANGRAVPTKPQSVRLREMGQELLSRSRDVWNTDEGHPAYERILGELAPDEARILMLLLTGGPQPSVDVRTGGPAGMVHSHLIAPGLTMIGARAGCRYLDHVPAYLNNLFRLGLVWFSREPLRDPMEYQVVEAQPDVLAALHSVKFAKVVRRSIHLTPFGEDFCRTCLVEDETLATTAFPEHAVPPEIEKE